MPEGFRVQGHDYVSLVNAGRGTGPMRIDTHHHGSRAVFPLDRDRLKSQAQITARDPPVGFKLRRHPLDGPSRNDENPPTWPEYCHADRSTVSTERETPFCVSAQPNIKLYPRVDLAAAEGTPRAPGV